MAKAGFFIFIPFAQAMKYLIVGLGNIGAEYECTRHNIGFMVNDAIAVTAQVSFSVGRLASIATFKHKGRQIHLIKPSTYMNLSGKAVNYWMNELKILKENLLVVTDDVALPLEKIRMRGRGSSAGHNGLKSIEEYLGQEYARLRIGIGNDYPKGKQADYVLSRFNAEESDILPGIIDNCAQAVLSFCTIGIERTMNTFNN